MGTDDDITDPDEIPCFFPPSSVRQMEPARPGYIRRQAGEPFPERPLVLACQQCRRYDDLNNLFPGHCARKGGTKRHFRLPETDIAADQAIHRSAAGGILEYGIDGELLVFGLVVGNRAANSS